MHFAHFIAQNAGKNDDSDFNPHPRWDLIIVSLAHRILPYKTREMLSFFDRFLAHYPYYRVF